MRKPPGSTSKPLEKGTGRGPRSTRTHRTRLYRNLGLQSDPPPQSHQRPAVNHGNADRRETRQRWQHRNCPETRQVVANDRRPSVSKDSPPDNTGCEPCDREGEKRRPDSSTRAKRLDRRGSFQSPDSHGPLPQDKGPGHGTSFYPTLRKICRPEAACEI